MQPESKKQVKEGGGGGGGFFPNQKQKNNKKEEMLQKGGSNIWIVPVPHDQISTHCVKRIDLQSCWLQYMHSFTQKKVRGVGASFCIRFNRKNNPFSIEIIKRIQTNK